MDGWYSGLTRRQIKEEKFMMGERAGRTNSFHCYISQVRARRFVRIQNRLYFRRRAVRARALQSIPAGKRIVGRKCTYARVAKRCERSVRDISPLRGGEEGERARLPLTKSTPTRSVSPKSQGFCQGYTAECTECSRYNPRRVFPSISANSSPRDSIVASI